MRSGVSSFQAARLTQARESLGLTKVALASLVEVSQATITNWEHGRQFPEEIKLRAISEKLNMPMHWFLRELPEHGDGAYFFRTMAATSKSARIISKTRLDWMAEISGTLQKWLNWPEIKIPLSGEFFLRLSDEEIESYAEKTRQALSLGFGPIQDVVLAIENGGGVCARDDIGFTKMDGISHWSSLDNRPYIFLANDKNNGIRSRFDAAHELGHVVLHKNVSLDEQKKYHKEVERQANLFAGCFLLPAESFVKDVSRPTVETLLALKPRWKVSIAAMIMRCYQLDLIDDNQKLNLFKRLSAKGWRTKEPFDDQVPFENSRLLPRAVSMLVDQNIISKRDLLEEFALPPTICEGLCGLPEGFFREPKPEIDNLVQLKVAGTVSKSVHKAKVYEFQKS